MHDWDDDSWPECESEYEESYSSDYCRECNDYCGDDVGYCDCFEENQYQCDCEGCIEGTDRSWEETHQHAGCLYSAEQRAVKVAEARKAYKKEEAEIAKAEKERKAGAKAEKARKAAEIEAKEGQHGRQGEAGP